MIKQSLTAATGLFLVITAHAQLWDGGDPDDIGYIGPSGGCNPTGSPSTSLPQVEEMAAMRSGNSVLIYAGGCFNSMGGVPNSTGIAAWDTLNHTWSALPFTNFNGKVKDLVTWKLTPGRQVLVIAGEFDFSSAVANGEDLAFFDGTDVHSLSSFTSNSGNPNGPVNTIAIAPNGDLCIAGAFDNIGGVSIGKNQRFVACINAAPAPAARSVRKWGNGNYPGVNGSIKDMAITPNGNVLYVIGKFDFAPQQAVCPTLTTVKGVARLRINSNRWQSLACGINDGTGTFAISYHQQQVWIGGVQQLRGINQNGSSTPKQNTPILRWSALPGPNGATTWDHGPFFGITDPTVHEFYRHQGAIYIGGTFDSSNPVRVGEVSGNAFQPLAGNAIPNSGVKAILETKYNSGKCTSRFVAGSFYVHQASPGNRISEATLPGGKCDPPPSTVECDFAVEKKYVGLNSQGAHEYEIKITNISKCTFDGFLQVVDEANGNISIAAPSGQQSSCHNINDLEVECSIQVNDFGLGDVYHLYPAVYAFGQPPGFPPDNCATLELLSFNQDTAGNQIPINETNTQNNSSCYSH